MPGAIFHLTARTIRGRRWFVAPLRNRAIEVIADTVPRSGARLLAAAVMGNHLHLVVQQGTKPLSALMQPLLRRLALELQRAHRLEGPIFWRTYASQPCLNPSYARNAIVYTHLNPVRAGLCDDPDGYPWTSHRLYTGDTTVAGSVLDPLRHVIDPSVALPLFASETRRTTHELRGDYRSFVRWRLASDTTETGDETGSDDSVPTGVTRTPAWGVWYSPLFHSPLRPGSMGPGLERHGVEQSARDMAAIAREALRAEAPGRTMEQIRGRWGGREITRLRHHVIRRLHASGFRNVQIARFMDISESGVSFVLRNGWRNGH